MMCVLQCRLIILIKKKIFSRQSEDKADCLFYIRGIVFLIDNIERIRYYKGEGYN